MKRTTRYDRITLDRSRAIMLDNGMMRVPAKLSRTGVQEYLRGDGSREIAYRPEDEVKASAAGFEGAALVNDHPYADQGVVDSTNYKRLSVGTVLNPVYRDGFVHADLMIQDAEAVKAVTGGKLELSAGYFMDRDETPGITPEGVRYDFVQRNIRPNHVAIVDEGRAGPEVRIQLDAAISTDFPAPISGSGKRPQGETTMKKITVDGVEVEVSDLAATLFQKERAMATGLLDASKSEVATAKADLVKTQAQCDAATEKIAKLEAELKAAPEKARLAHAERSALETKAKALAPELKCDGLDDKAVKRAVCANAGIKLDGKDDAYVSARFDVLVEDAEKKNPAADAVAAALRDPAKSAASVTDSNETPKQKMEREFFNPPAAK